MIILTNEGHVRIIGPERPLVDDLDDCDGWPLLDATATRDLFAAGEVASPTLVPPPERSEPPTPKRS